ncbi:transcription termination factor Rho [Eubacterium sp. MSJ-13]|uniref:transcription termination factor Rho n=1 Tax=Eubacterium sp. MSJ-13 TaxID=2841513 RepID=UPI001C121B14|nr:transcription termination factor Rho [Eubacterium sp. MSJ-13]MBU5478295.1 transcription termination factor Rho [Eubacterium sp. MSJ-13]
MADLEKMSLVELRVAGRKMGVKNVTTYKKRELLELLLSIQKEQETETTENSEGKNEDVVMENTAGDVKEKKTRSKKKDEESKKESDDKQEDASEEKGTAGNVDDVSKKNTEDIQESDSEEKKQQNQNNYVRNNDYNNNDEHRNTYRARREGGYQSSYSYQGRNSNVRGQQRNNGRVNMRQGNNPYSNQNPGYSSNSSYQPNLNHGGYQNNYNQNNGVQNSGYSQNTYNSNGGYQNGYNQNNSTPGSSYSQNNYNSNNGYQTNVSQNIAEPEKQLDISQLDSGETREGILEIMAEGYGFIRCDNFLPGDDDVYVSHAMIKKYRLRTGDILKGNLKVRSQTEKFAAMLYVTTVNGYPVEELLTRPKFEQLIPIFPDERIRLETDGSSISMRMMDIVAPIGKGQRGMIVSQPKTGKTTLLKQVAKAVKTNHPKMHIIVLLIDERPEEVTDIKESIMGHNVEVIYSTFDELPENHKRVSEMVIERAKRLVEHGEDVMILLDSITRLARAYNLTVAPSGRTLSGGLDPAALHMPKKFFGAARNMREGGSLTILATALVDTGSKMDDVVFEEFKGTGNMELVLDRSLSEKRVFPAIDLPKSSTRRDDLLLTQDEKDAAYRIRKVFSTMRNDEAVEKIIDLFRKTRNNREFVEMIRKIRF